MQNTPETRYLSSKAVGGAWLYAAVHRLCQVLVPHLIVFWALSDGG